MIEFIKPWRVCPGCRQEYQNELRIDIASKFVSFVRRQYPSDTRNQLEALFVKLRALDSMLKRLTTVQKREAGVTANVMLSLIDRIKTEGSPLSKRYSQTEGFAYHTHGRIAFIKGTEESLRRAVAHFEKELEVFEAIGYVEGVATAKRNMAGGGSSFESACTRFHV
jgi:hypothetical protein